MNMYKLKLNILNNHIKIQRIFANSTIPFVNSVNSINTINSINTVNTVNTVNTKSLINYDNPVNSVNSINTVNTNNTNDTNNTENELLIDYDKTINTMLTQIVASRKKYTTFSFDEEIAYAKIDKDHTVILDIPIAKQLAARNAKLTLIRGKVTINMFHNVFPFRHSVKLGNAMLDTNNYVLPINGNVLDLRRSNLATRVNDIAVNGYGKKLEGLVYSKTYCRWLFCDTWYNKFSDALNAYYIINQNAT